MAEQVTHDVVDDSGIQPEHEKIAEWRRMSFFKILGDDITESEIELLVMSDVSPHQAQKLKDKECPTELILEILL